MSESEAAAAAPGSLNRSEYGGVNVGRDWKPIDKWPKNLPPPKAARNYHEPFDPLWYHEADLNDPKQLERARRSTIQEQWIRLMRSRIIREELDKCYLNEGVNHVQACKYWSDMYMEALRRGDNEIRGYKAVEQTYNDRIAPGIWSPEGRDVLPREKLDDILGRQKATVFKEARN